MWILIVIATWSIGGYATGGGSIVTFQEFDSAKSCNQARVFMEQKQGISTTCIEKGSSQ